MGGTASGAAPVRRCLMPVSGLHRQVASIALAAAARHGFALGGGNALLAHGLTTRPTQDVDLFTDQEHGVEAATAAVEAALLRGQSTGLPADRLHLGPALRAPPVLPTVCRVIPDETARPALPQQYSSSLARAAKGETALRATDPGRPRAVLAEAPWRARRALEDCISTADGSGDYDASVQAAQPQLAADPRVHEPPGVLTESGGEFGAAQVRLIGDLEDCRAHRQPRAWRQVRRAQVEIGVELITGQHTPLEVARDEQGGTGVHHRHLHSRMRRPVTGARARSHRPGVTRQAVFHIQSADWPNRDAADSDRAGPVGSQAELEFPVGGPGPSSG